MTFSIKQNDTAPSFRATLKDSDGDAVDLTNATVRFHMKAIGAETSKVDSSAILQDAANGVVQYNWVSGDTDTVGSYQAEFEVTYSDATVETFPNDSYLSISIKAELA